MKGSEEQGLGQLGEIELLQQDEQQPKLHPISLYLKIWGLLFVLSTMSYMVDYFEVPGVLRWTLILVFMTLKAGLIVTIFMHVKWERLAMKLLLFIPPIAIAIFIIMMAIGGDYTFMNRAVAFIAT